MAADRAPCTMTATETGILDALREAARAEKAQTLFYRSLTARAESESAELAERLNGLLADEQHHLSRLVARLLELGTRVDVPAGQAWEVALAGWEALAREREQAEIKRYERLLQLRLDPRTRAMIEEFLDVEQRHADSLGGKWMGAQGGRHAED